MLCCSRRRRRGDAYLQTWTAGAGAGTGMQSTWILIGAVLLVRLLGCRVQARQDEGAPCGICGLGHHNISVLNIQSCTCCWLVEHRIPVTHGKPLLLSRCSTQGKHCPKVGSIRTICFLENCLTQIQFTQVSPASLCMGILPRSLMTAVCSITVGLHGWLQLQHNLRYATKLLALPGKSRER